jgi:hypothetical protein
MWLRDDENDELLPFLVPIRKGGQYRRLSKTSEPVFTLSPLEVFRATFPCLAVFVVLVIVLAISPHEVKEKARARAQTIKDQSSAMMQQMTPTSLQGLSNYIPSLNFTASAFGFDFGERKSSVDLDDGEPERMVLHKLKDEPVIRPISSPRESQAFSATNSNSSAFIATVSIVPPGQCLISSTAGLKFDIPATSAHGVCCAQNKEAEPNSYDQTHSLFEDIHNVIDASFSTSEFTFYDSTCNKPVFVAPRSRTFAAWAGEAVTSGWMSFVDDEVVWENVRISKVGEVSSVCGTILGKYVPKKNMGSRYVVNLFCIAGRGDNDNHQLVSVPSPRH